MSAQSFSFREFRKRHQRKDPPGLSRPPWARIPGNSFARLGFAVPPQKAPRRISNLQPLSPARLQPDRTWSLQRLSTYPLLTTHYPLSLAPLFSQRYKSPGSVPPPLLLRVSVPPWQIRSSRIYLAGRQQYYREFTFVGQQAFWIGPTSWQQDARCSATRFACGEEHLEDKRDCLRKPRREIRNYATGAENSPGNLPDNIFGEFCPRAVWRRRNGNGYGCWRRHSWVCAT